MGFWLGFSLAWEMIKAPLIEDDFVGEELKDVADKAINPDTKVIRQYDKRGDVAFLKINPN